MSLKEKLQKIEDEKKKIIEDYFQSIHSTTARAIEKKKAYDLTVDEVVGSLIHLIELKQTASKGDNDAKSLLAKIVGLGENFRGAKRSKKTAIENKEAA